MATRSGTTSRTYEETHPWLTFQLDMRRASPRLWMNLGAIQSKCEHVANAMVPPRVAEELYNLYLAKGIRATTAIEGNTLSENEVRDRIVKKKALPKSQEYQGKEVDNIVSACNEIADILLRSEAEADVRLTPDGVCHFNAMVLDGLPLDEGVVPGQFRSYQVNVGRYRGAPPEDCRYLLERLCAWVNDLIPGEDEDDERIARGVLRAVMAHLYLVWIHPFGDGNGRTARLIEVQILLGAGVPTIAAHLLSNFYNRTRPEYYRQLTAASRSGGDVLPFLEYALQGLLDHLDFQIKRIRRDQWAVAWKDHVYESFRGAKTPASHRRRSLALELGRTKYRRKGVAIRDIVTLTPELAREYARKTMKTLSRDLNALEKQGLVARANKRAYAMRARLWALLPERLAKAQRR